MTKPISGLTTFGASTSGTTTQLDGNFDTIKTAINDLNTYSNYLTDTGAANAYAVALGANLTGALTDGLIIQVKFANTNTGASTLNYNLTGVIPVVNPDGSALRSSQIAANSILQLQYSSGLASWILQTSARAAGDFVILATQVANASASIFFNNSLSSTYDAYRLVFNNVSVPIAGAQLQLVYGFGNANYGATSNHSYYADYGSAGLGASVQQSSGSPSILLTNSGSRGIGNANGASVSGTIDIFGPVSATIQRLAAAVSYTDANANTASYRLAGSWANANANAASSVKIIVSNNNMTAGNFALYGLVKA